MSVFAAGLLLGQLAGLGPGGLTGTLSVGDRSEVRYRSVQGAPAAIDLDNAPNGAISLTGRRMNILLRYGARFSYVDVEHTRGLALLHAGQVAIDWHNRRLRLRLSMDGAIGTQTFSALAPNVLQPTPTTVPSLTGTASDGGPVPVAPQSAPVSPYVPFSQLQILYTGAASAFLGATYRLSPRWTGAANVGYSMTGGIDYVSQAVLRPNRGPSVGVDVAYTVDRRDRFGTVAHAAETIALATPLFPRQLFYTLEVLELWRHSLGMRTESTLGGGAVYLDAGQQANRGGGRSVNAAGQASLTHTVPLADDARLVFGATSELGAFYNQVGAVVQPQLSAALRSSINLRHMTVAGSADAATSLPAYAPYATRAVGGTLSAGYSPGDAIQLLIGFRANAQFLPTFAPDGTSLGSTQLTQWVAFVAVDLRAPVLHF